MDSAYLRQHVGKALALGLSEVCQKKPVDPIDYLSKWLRKHVENLKDEATEEATTKQLAKDRKQAAEEKRRQEAMEEEQEQIAKEILKRDLENINDEANKVEEVPIPSDILVTIDSANEANKDSIIPIQTEETSNITENDDEKILTGNTVANEDDNKQNSPTQIEEEDREKDSEIDSEDKVKYNAEAIDEYKDDDDDDDDDGDDDDDDGDDNDNDNEEETKNEESSTLLKNSPSLVGESVADEEVGDNKDIVADSLDA